jgi:putative membrane protein
MAMMGWYGNGGQMHWFGWIMMVGWLALLAAAVAAGIYLIARSRRAAAPGTGPGARQILDMRFARGEIDSDEYRLRRDALSEMPPP